MRGARIGWLTMSVGLSLVAGCDALKEVQQAAQEQVDKPVSTLNRGDDDEPQPPPQQPVPDTAEPSVRVVAWDDILGSSQTEWPEPRADLIWQNDVRGALAEAEAENRPMFVVIRCPESAQFAALDTAMDEAGSELQNLLRQFVTVRLTRADDIDLTLLPVEDFQDTDVSWWGWFLSDAGQVYGVFGGRDFASDDSRVSPQALTESLRRVLNHHYDPRRPEWNIDGPQPDLSAEVVTARNQPGYSSWHQKSAGSAELDCLRCHHVSQVLLQPRLDSGDYDKSKEIWVWPPAESVGLTLDRDHGLKVTTVTPDSPAAAAGLLPGDVMAAVGGGALTPAATDNSSRGRRLFSQADLQAALERAPFGPGELQLHWLRDGKVMHAVLQLPGNWRDTGLASLAWRPSIIFGQIGAVPGFLPQQAPEGIRRRLRLPPNAMAVVPQLPPQSPAYRAGLRPEHVILQIDLVRPNLSGFPFIVWFRQTFTPGQEITLRTISMKDGTTSRITYKVPAFTAQ